IIYSNFKKESVNCRLLRNRTKEFLFTEGAAKTATPFKPVYLSSRLNCLIRTAQSDRSSAFVHDTLGTNFHTGGEVT
ncbi:MAG: hypothetical protein IIT42_00580, partial [Clostridia bacterium]|nr:hypothetical protein [Clostridia bacterium]